MMKAMMQALKDKKYSKHDVDSNSDDPSDKDAELAPESSAHGAELHGGGHSEGHQAADTGPEHNQNVNDNSKGKGLNKLEFPHNSKDEFIDVKKTIGGKSPNHLADKMASGNGQDQQKDNMDVDVTEDPEKMGRPQTLNNFKKNNEKTLSIKNDLDSKMSLGDIKNQIGNKMGMESEDADADTNVVQPEILKSGGSPQADNSDLKGLAKARGMFAKKFGKRHI